jgi:hypothetical protein
VNIQDIIALTVVAAAAAYVIRMAFRRRSKCTSCRCACKTTAVTTPGTIPLDQYPSK